MNNSALQQSLVEFEENLKSLESARTQVDKVSGKVEQVTIAFTKILKQIELLQKEFDNEQGYFKDIISKSIKNFTTTLESKKTEISNLTTELTKDLSNSTGDSIKSFNSSIEIAKKDISDSTNKLSQSLSQSISETVDKLQTFQKFIDDTTEKVRNLDFEKSLKEINTRIEIVNGLIVTLSKDVADSNKEMMSRLEIQEKNYKKRSAFAIIISIVGFVTVIILMLVLK